MGLILEVARYNTIPGSPHFRKPTDPGVFQPRTTTARPGTRSTEVRKPTPLSASDLEGQKAQQEEKLRVYNECQRVELALRYQLIEAVEPIFLKPMLNIHTNMINDSIHTIITFLKDRHGKISDPQLMEKERELLDLTWDPSEQPDYFFNKLDKYVDLCKIIKKQLYDRQNVQLSYCIFQKVGVYQDTLKKWNAKASAKIFEEFKTFMIMEHEQLEEVGTLNVKHSDLNHANIIQSINEKHEELSQKLEDRLKVNFKEGLDTCGNIEQCPRSVPSYDSSLS